MGKLRGLITVLIFGLIIGIEFKYLILDADTSSDKTLSTEQYWALTIPVFLIVTLISLLGMWIGYTMMVSKKPVRMTYDSAYEEAAGALHGTRNPLPFLAALTQVSADVRNLARKCGPNAVKTLRLLLGDQDPRVRIAAAQVLLDRGHGRAAAQADVPAEITIRIVA